PALLAQSGQTDAAVSADIVERLGEVPGQLLRAPDDRDRDHVAALLEQLLDELEPGLLSIVDRLAVEKPEELLERGAERHARVVDEAPRLVELAPGGVRGVEAPCRRAGGHCRDDVARELRRDRRNTSQLHEADFA